MTSSIYLLSFNRWKLLWNYYYEISVVSKMQKTFCLLLVDIIDFTFIRNILHRFVFACRTQQQSVFEAEKLCSTIHARLLNIMYDLHIITQISQEFNQNQHFKLYSEVMVNIDLTIIYQFQWLKFLQHSNTYIHAGLSWHVS